jgi:hypothetical protein
MIRCVLKAVNRYCMHCACMQVTVLVLEWARHGELLDFVARTGGLSEPVARTYFAQVPATN